MKAKNRRRLSSTGVGIAEELLSPNLSGPLELLMSTIEPGADSGEYHHDGREAGVVVQGELELGAFATDRANDGATTSRGSVGRCEPCI